ncbi:ATP-dependent endonuclease [Stappia sp. P2PMeth1]|uniref:ATP-dependent nuclease n=1 Tax=Stappia sp. P2PMeth1 TaxID=2003586 RepID=UPI00164912B4|nr:AAA family ATPase [Stappia sp. P2PMeth1]
MNLIHEIEISYFRSFYKFKMRDLSDLNIIFGKNDSGKSNIVRSLNLFFSGNPETWQEFDFSVDFSEQRLIEVENSEDLRKFLYVKITFNTPANYQRSLGQRFYVKRQWTVSRGSEYIEEISNHIPSSRKHIVTRFLNKIKFIHIPAIKDIHIFEMLLENIHETVANSEVFLNAVDVFSKEIQNITREMFQTLPTEISSDTKIGAPTQLAELFQTLDFETLSDGETSAKSLTRQRGDGIKVRHIPELLRFISNNDSYDYHIWGFEEPENSLDFVASQSEAQRFLSISKENNVQVFITTHSPSFYLLDDAAIAKIYVYKKDGKSEPVQGKELSKLDPQTAIGEGFYLPAVADALKNIANIEARAKVAEERVSDLMQEINNVAMPVLLTEGRTDAQILRTAWNRRRGGEPPFAIRSCETGDENAGGGTGGGAQTLAVRLRGIANNHPHTVIGLFDYDQEGKRAYQLDKNFVDQVINRESFKKARMDAPTLCS